MNVLAIDIGGTSIKYAEMTDELKILSKSSVPTPLTSCEDLIDALAKIYNEFPSVAGIAISMPGIIDSKNGYCMMGGALRYNDDFYLRHALYEKCPVKISIENDAKCAALAEAAATSRIENFIAAIIFRRAKYLISSATATALRTLKASSATVVAHRDFAKCTLTLKIFLSMKLMAL